VSYLPTFNTTTERKATISIQLAPRRKQIIKEFPELEVRQKTNHGSLLPQPIANLQIQQPPKPLSKAKIPTFSTFQLIPHSSIKNEKMNQFADCISDTYMEFFQRFKSGRIEPDRVFFETVMTNKTFKTFVSTNSDLADMVKQQSQVIWKGLTILDVDPLNDINSNSLGYDFRLKYPNFMSLTTDQKLTVVPLSELLEVSQFMQDGDQAIIQFGFQAAEESWYKDAEEDFKIFDKKPPKKWGRQQLKNPSIMKPSLPGFDFVLRVIVDSKDERRKRRLARGIILSLKQLNLDNELEEKMIKPSKMKKWLNDVVNHEIRIPLLIGKRQIITPPEIGHFIKLPAKSLQEEYPIIENISKPELTLPDELFMQDVLGIDIGTVTEKGKKRLARFPVNAFSKTALKYVLDAYCLPEFVFGEMGSGKTGEAIHRAHSAISLGQSVFFFDTSDGAACKELHDSLPIDYPDEKLIHLDLTNKAWPIALRWDLRSVSTGDADLEQEMANETGRMFLRQFVDGMASAEFTDRMDRYLSSAARSAGSDPLSIEMALTSPAYREELMSKKEVQSQTDIMMELEALQQKAKRGSDDVSVDGIISRLRTLSSDRFRTNLFYQKPKPNKSLNFRQYADNLNGGYGYCVTIYCDKNSFGPEGQEAIMTYLLAKVLLEGAYSRVDTPDHNKRKPFNIIVDEPHRFIKGDMATKLGEDAAVELRKYRCKLVMMNHSRDQLGKLWDSFESGGIQVTMYKSKDVKAFQDMAPIIAPLDSVEVWKSLGQHEAVVTRKLPSKKEVSFICKMATPPEEVKNRSKRREECAREFGRPWKEVADEIQNIRLDYMKKDQKWFSRMEKLEKEAKEREQEEKRRIREAEKQAAKNNKADGS
jgi:hypothetical protein